MGTWTLPFAIYQLLLSARVSTIRANTNTLIGERTKGKEYTGVDPLTLATRSHANFLENVPLALIFAAVAELNGASKKGLNYTLAALFIARIMHVELGMRAKEDTAGLGRLIGHLVTQSSMAGIAAYTAYLIKGYWGY